MGRRHCVALCGTSSTGPWRTPIPSWHTRSKGKDDWNLPPHTHTHPALWPQRSGARAGGPGGERRGTQHPPPPPPPLNAPDWSLEQSLGTQGVRKGPHHSASSCRRWWGQPRPHRPHRIIRAVQQHLPLPQAALHGTLAAAPGWRTHRATGCCALARLAIADCTVLQERSSPALTCVVHWQAPYCPRGRLRVRPENTHRPIITCLRAIDSNTLYSRPTHHP